MPPTCTRRNTQKQKNRAADGKSASAFISWQPEALYVYLSYPYIEFDEQPSLKPRVAHLKDGGIDGHPAELWEGRHDCYLGTNGSLEKRGTKYKFTWYGCPTSVPVPFPLYSPQSLHHKYSDRPMCLPACFWLTVVKFMDVYKRSYCRPIETLVDIFQEYPDEIEYIFKPSCVPLMRCGGCCNDESLECVPTEEFNITMQIMRIKPHQGQHIGEMSFLQHSRCECR
ncbi:Vascular endothelial growth factor A [Heterocephalus glaber]|uniref:Vascular permeability factor n=1 Tax=Heterocephalus glaber TaxID=10181 RepID=G5BNN4_HETGA|nr:Vascular endothelial growth factor A [Heterocephalus glaber]